MNQLFLKFFKNIVSLFFSITLTSIISDPILNILGSFKKLIIFSYSYAYKYLLIINLNKY